MLIEQYIKHVERYFWDRKQIQKVVDEEKEQRTARKGHTGGGMLLSVIQQKQQH